MNNEESVQTTMTKEILLQGGEIALVDDADYASEMGDGGAWVRNGLLTRQAFHDEIDGLACDYAAALRAGRRSAGQRTVALIQGMAIGDVAFATHIIRARRAAMPSAARLQGSL